MQKLIAGEVLFAMDGTSDGSGQGAARGKGLADDQLVAAQELPVASAEPAAALADKASAAARQPAKRRSLRKYVIAVPVVLVVLAGALYAGDYLVSGWYQISTDDAYVRADISNVSAKIGGYIKSFGVADNSTVAPDTVIAEIDDGDYQIALAAAQRKADTQQATIARFDSQLKQADATIEQANAQLDAAQADYTRTESDFTRYTQLAKTNISPVQRLEQAVADRDKARAAIATAKSAQDGAVAARQVLVAQQTEAKRLLDELLVQVDKAKRDLSFTKVRAAVGGTFGNKSSQVGTLVQPGTRLGALIESGSLYVEANFKETQIRDMKPGQPVTIEVDALGSKVLHGTVDSFAPGSGSVFSLLPPENATGNFTKIVQRVPVRIALPAGNTLELLRPGLSVYVTVDTKASLVEGQALASEEK